MSVEEVEEVKNEEATEITNTETNEAEPEKTINEVIETEEPKQTEEVKEAKPKPKAKATAKKLPRSVKVVDLVECEACLKKMLPKSLRNTHPYYCKGAPTETLPVNKQKASYGSKVEQKLKKEIEEEMRKKYEPKEPRQNEVTQEVVQYSEPIEVKTKQRPIRMEEPVSHEVRNEVRHEVRNEVRHEVRNEVRQPTATELLQQSYNEMRRLKQQEKQETINRFKSSMF